MFPNDKERWDGKYISPSHKASTAPRAWLTANAELLTGKGKALDIAMGEGRNAVYLAALGYDVVGVDISDVGVKNALALAEKKKVRIEAVVEDLNAYRFGQNEFHLILCFNFLNRGLFTGIRNALRPGGMLFFETFNVDYLKYRDFRREWVLERNELLREFGGFRILRYQETDHDGKAVASLVAEKPVD